MGHSQSTTKAPATASPNFRPDVEVIQAKSFDAHYGEVKVVRDKNTKQTYFLKDIVVNTKQAFETELAFYQGRVGVRHPNVVSVVGYTSEDKHNFCSTYYKISVFIEILEQDLLRDFEQHKAQKTHYTEHELLLIASDCVNALTVFQAEGHSHGDIRPFNIFVKDRVYKLSDPSLVPQKGSNGLTLAAIQQTHTLLSPEWLRQVPDANLEIKGDKSKSDVFSLGATLLALATLQNSEDLYDYKHGKVNEVLLSERVASVKGHYSPFTHDLIRDMLILDPAFRVDFTALSNRLLPFQHDIRTGSQLPFLAPTQNYDTRHKVEQAKKAAPAPVNLTPVEYHPASTAPVDDLDARIRAALERSAATFKAVETRDYTNVNYTPVNYTPVSYTSTTTTPVTYTPSVNTYVPTTHVVSGDYTPSRHVETVKSSALPVQHHVEVTPTAATNINYTTSVYASEPQSYTATSYAAPVNYTSTYATPNVDVDRILRSSQVHEPLVSSYAYTSTTPVNYTTTTTNVPGTFYTPEYHTTSVTAAPIEQVIRHSEDHVVKAAPKQIEHVKSSAPRQLDYGYTNEIYAAPSSYSTTTYVNGGVHQYQPDYTQFNNVEVSHVVNRVGGEVHDGVEVGGYQRVGEVAGYQRLGGQVEFSS